MTYKLIYSILDNYILQLLICNKSNDVLFLIQILKIFHRLLLHPLSLWVENVLEIADMSSRFSANYHKVFIGFDFTGWRGLFRNNRIIFGL